MKRARSDPPGQRQLRVGELIRHALVEIIHRGEIHDSVFDNLTVTVSEVRMTPDLKSATVFVMPLGGAGAESIVAAFERNTRFLRGQIGRRVRLRYVPELRFCADTSFDEAERIDALLRSPEVKRDLDAKG